jgi:outer membrane protein assembly factor BamE (lipoprotein component of BamABCDE complex)
MNPSTLRRSLTVGALVALAGALGACTTPGTKEELQARSGYACCNLHYQRDKISDANWHELPFYPAGTPVRVTGLHYDRATVVIDGAEMYIRQEYGREQETLGKFIAKTIVAEDPRPKIAAWPKEVQDAIRAARVMPGMTKEQVIVSLGYPMTSETPSLDASTWRYYVGSFDPYDVVWGADGRVQEVRGIAPVRARVVYPPGR